MSAQQNEALVRRYFEEAWVKGNLAAVEDFMVPNYIEHQVPDVHLASRDSLKQLLATYYKAFPDMKSVLHDIFAQGDRVAFRWSVSGTHLGDWVGIPPTGNHITASGITIYRITGGKAVEGWTSIDISRSEEEQRWLSEGRRTDEAYPESGDIPLIWAGREHSPTFDDLTRNLTWRFRAAEARERERIEQEDGRLGLVVDDATGHGMPAALVMATTRSMLRAVVKSLESPGGVLARVNEALVADIPPSTFVTCFYGVLDPKDGHMSYANAGHNLPCRRHDGQAEELRARGMPLGLIPGMRYEQKETILASGDSTLFYSDGLVEAHDPQGEMFGFPRLRELVAGHGEERSLGDFLMGELYSFVGEGWEQEDDITLLTLKRSARRS